MAGYAQIALVRGLGFLANSQTAVANNLANATTAGYKRRTPVAEITRSRFQSLLERDMSSVIYSEQVDWSEGTRNPTNDRFNIALDDDRFDNGGSRFFRVKDPAGNVYYTRRGELQVDQQGYLVAPGGDRYLDDTGQEIQVGSSSSFDISPRGIVTGSVAGAQQLFGTIGVFQVPNPRSLRAIGQGRYADTRNQTVVPDNPGVIRQGYLEQSNVEPMNELVRMITIQRGFQATARALGSVGRLEESFVAALNR